MKLKEYLQGDASLTGLSLLTKKSASYLWQIADGRRTCSPALSVQIENATNGQVTRKDLRPDDYHLIWQELKEDAE